ncbi:unnamed protein product [Musa textilis]
MAGAESHPNLPPLCWFRCRLDRSILAMGTGCKSASHHLLRCKARNRADDLQEMFDDLQSAIKESRAADVAVLEEQVHQRLRECWAELNQPSPATSLQLIESEADLSFCLFVCSVDLEFRLILCGQGNAPDSSDLFS